MKALRFISYTGWFLFSFLTLYVGVSLFDKSKNSEPSVLYVLRHSPSDDLSAEEISSLRFSAMQSESGIDRVTCLVLWAVAGCGAAASVVCTALQHSIGKR